MKREKPTDPAALQFLATMRKAPAHRVARAMTRACTNAVNFYGCRKTLLASAWAAYANKDPVRVYRFKPGTTLETLLTAALKD